MLIAHKIALDPNNVQTTYFARASGCARFAYNWALDQWGKQYEVWKLDNNLPKPNEMALRRQLNSIKREQFPWMLEVTKCAPQLGIRQLGTAFKNFFAGWAKYPRFRKRGIDDRFSISNDQFNVEGKRIRIPNLGWVKMREALRFKGKIMSATISRRADRWFVSITVEIPDSVLLPRTENQGAAGVDLGLHALATLSTGEKIGGMKPYKSQLKRLQRLSRSLSRKQKESRNREKTKMKLARLHARIADVRQDALHKLTTELTVRFGIIGIEDLNVKGMMRNHHLARSVADMSFFEFRRQLEYKAAIRGCKVAVADRWFPSSKTCSHCGHKLESLSLATRQWTCPVCHSEHDRDINAAINVRNMAVSSTVSACGEESSGLDLTVQVKLASMKQEVSATFMSTKSA
jgi:putative transposase